MPSLGELMKTKTIEIINNCSEFNSYRSARVKSLFNCESGADFKTVAQIPDDSDWRIGVIVGPSGSGKTSIGKKIWPNVGIYNGDEHWANDKPIIDCIAPDGSFDDVTGALSAVGLGSVPAWLRPYHVLSNGERFRAAMARVVAEKYKKVIIDEFTSVVDRQIAKVGAAAFSKSWKRTDGQCILLSCHYDILDWVEPDWVYDTSTGELQRGLLWRRPKFQLDVYQTNSRYWRLFEPHHYLKIPLMVAAKYYVGFVEGQPVCHIATSPRLEVNAMRACRMVVMPEWQGAGVGMKFLNEVCAMQFTEVNPHYKRVKAVYFHTSHPGLCAALRRDKNWVQCSQLMGGGHKGRSAATITNSSKSLHTKPRTGYGGHFRAVQGFKFLQPTDAAA